ncbi:MAG: hypothetical protein Q8888_01460 [Vigna little leaf phytoplasma]|nr:hypothetical protein [Vigna little leaf phytoplasma]
MHINIFIINILIIIVIFSLLGFVIFFSFYSSFYDIKQEATSLSPEKIITKKVTPNSLGSKRENVENIFKTKIPIIRERFKQITDFIVSNYYFGEHDNPSLLFDNLSEREKVVEIKNDYERIFKYSKSVSKEETLEKEFHKYKSELAFIPLKIEKLQTEKKALERYEKIKSEIVKLKYQLGQILTSYASVFERFNNIDIENPQAPNKNEEIRLQLEINKLQKKITEIIKKIGKIKIDITNLETFQKKYQEMLSRIGYFQKDLEKDYKNLISDNHLLHSLYNITSAEG